MTTLFLDFASHKKFAAVIRDGKTCATVAIDDHAKEAELLPTLTMMLERAGVRLDELKRIAMTTGPGGFMSLRAGLSLGNALAWSLKIPVGGVHLSDLWQARAGRTDVLWLHSTKRELLFVRKVDSEPELKKFEGLSAELGARAYVGELIPEHANALSVTMASDLRSLEDVLPKLTDALSYTTPPLLPWYGRGI